MTENPYDNNENEVPVELLDAQIGPIVGGIVDPVRRGDCGGPVSDPRAEQAPSPESMMLSGAGTVGSF